MITKTIFNTNLFYLQVTGYPMMRFSHLSLRYQIVGLFLCKPANLMHKIIPKIHLINIYCQKNKKHEKLHQISNC